LINMLKNENNLRAANVELMKKQVSQYVQYNVSAEKTMDAMSIFYEKYPTATIGFESRFMRAAQEMAASKTLSVAQDPHAAIKLMSRISELYAHNGKIAAGRESGLGLKEVNELNDYAKTHKSNEARIQKYTDVVYTKFYGSLD